MFYLCIDKSKFVECETNARKNYSLFFKNLTCTYLHEDADLKKIPFE